jgi:hypothetical protein
MDNIRLMVPEIIVQSLQAGIAKKRGTRYMQPLYIHGIIQQQLRI